jgi:hypothetical protein
MNPLLAIGWELSRDYTSSGIHLSTFQEQSFYCLTFLTVYAIAPTVGACLAALVTRHIFGEKSPLPPVSYPPASLCHPHRPLQNSVSASPTIEKKRKRRVRRSRDLSFELLVECGKIRRPVRIKTNIDQLRATTTLGETSPIIEMVSSWDLSRLRRHFGQGGLPHIGVFAHNNVWISHTGDGTFPFCDFSDLLSVSPPLIQLPLSDMG